MPQVIARLVFNEPHLDEPAKLAEIIDRECATDILAWHVSGPAYFGTHLRRPTRSSNVEAAFDFRLSFGIKA